MSEHSPSTPPQIDADLAFDPDKRQEQTDAELAQAEVDLYAENRPYQDSEGITRDPQGNPIDPEKYFDDQREIAKAESESQTPYQDMSIQNLAYKLGEAEYHNDRTIQGDVNQVLLAKLGEEEDKILAESGGDKQAASKKIDILVDSTLSSKDLKIRQLRKKHGLDQPETEEPEETPPEPTDPPEPTPPEEPEVLDAEEGEDPPETILANLPNLDLEAYQRDYYAKHKKHFEPRFEGKKVYYAPNERGYSQLGLEYRSSGEVIDWQSLGLVQGNQIPEDFSVVIRASNDEGQYVGYIKGNKIYEITKEGVKAETLDLENDESLPVMMIGQKFGDYTLDKIEIKLQQIEYDDNTKAQLQAQMTKALKTRKESDAAIAKQAEGILAWLKIPRGENPFAEADLAITKIEGSQQPLTPQDILDNAGRVIGGRTWRNAHRIEADRLANKQRTETYDAQEAIDSLEQFSLLFEDPTYVPKPEVFKEIQNLAKHIVVTTDNDETVYKLSDGTELPLETTEIFIRNAQNSHWVLSSLQEDSIRRAITKESRSSILKRKLFNGQLPADDIMPVAQFKKELQNLRSSRTREYMAQLDEDESLDEDQKNEMLANKIEKELGKWYTTYLSDKIELSKSINGNTKTGPYARRDRHTDRQAVDAYGAAERRQAAANEAERRRQHIDNRTRVHSRGRRLRQRAAHTARRVRIRR